MSDVIAETHPQDSLSADNGCYGTTIWAGGHIQIFHIFLSLHKGMQTSDIIYLIVSDFGILL